MIVAAITADHAITIRDVVAASVVVIGVIGGLAVFAGLLALAAKGWDH